MAIVTKKEFRHFLHDRVAVLLLIGCSVLVLTNTLMVLARVHMSDLQVPVRYTQYSSTLDRGHWTVLYELALFSLVALVLNGMLAVKIRTLRKTYAWGLLLLTLVVLLVGFLVTRALTGLLAA